MDEPGGQTNWQSMGSTLNDEYRYVTHLGPVNQPSGGVHKQHLHRGRSTRSTRSTRSKDMSNLHRQTSRHLITRLKQFVHRLTWRKRSKSYIFGKQYLQRQPSFVMTPDHSSFTYRFRSRDLVKSRPHPRYDRMAHPIAAWKHGNPMSVLLNRGQTDVPLPGDIGVSSPRDQDEIDAQPENQNVEPVSADDQTAHGAPQTWKKVSLPVKQDRTSGSSQDREQARAGEQSTPHNTTDRSGSGSGSGSQSKSRSHVSYASSALDIPPTPLETRHPPPKAIDLPSRALPFADSDTHVPRSPTSARSLYRPESWRRSAVISRTDQLAEPDMTELDVAIEFVGAWGTYLKRAIAVRALAERERKSWELHTEQRWSYNLPYDSDSSTFESSSASRTMPEDFDVGSNDRSHDSSSSGRHGQSTASTGVSDSPRDKQAAPPIDDPNSGVWNSDSNDQGSLRDAASESSSIKSRTVEEGEEPNPAGPAEEESHLSSPSVQYTPEVISTRSSSSNAGARPQTSDYPRSPMKSTSSLAPINSPRALAAMARTSAERKRFSDSVDAAEKRYSVLFQPESAVASPTAQSHLGDLTEVSQWQPDDSDKEASAPSNTENDERVQVSALRVRKTQAQMDTLLNVDIQPDEFDFADLSVSRKRPLPISPVSTPSGSTESLSLDANAQRPTLHQRHSSSSLNSGVEDAPSLLKNRSTRKHSRQHSHKRVKSSASRENLLVIRQNTMRSHWAEEDSDTDASEQLETVRQSDIAGSA